MTRRELFADAALLAAAQSPVQAQAARTRGLLVSLWASDKLAPVARSRFHPFPAASERAGWEALPASARAELIAAGERQLATPWQVLPATIALEFARNGNRSHYEALSFGRRTKLAELTVAECAEGKGRFIDEIVNGIWLVTEETFWGVPAHLGVQKARVGLPDVSEPIVDLFAAETAAQLAWTLYLLEPQLQQVSPLVPARIRLETTRRMLTPCLERNFAWMGFGTPPPNNWNPWICSNWLTSVLLVESSEERRAAAIQKIVQSLDHFLNGYADDGGCDEGPSYWGRAGASLFDCLELFYLATNGAVTAYDQPLIRQIGLYICRAHVAGDWYTNFSDAPARVHADGDLIYRYGRRIGDDAMARHGAWVAGERATDTGSRIGSLGRTLPALFNLAELNKAPRAEALERDAWMPGIGVMTARQKNASRQGLYVAAESGHNGKSHNHNDVGNFVVYADGAPVIIDVGVETYTAKTFGARRYEIWTMQSAYHNCPTIDGVMQSPGRKFAASSVEYRQDNAAAELKMDIAGAYPENANLASWKRSIRLDRARNELVVSDAYTLNRAAKEITLTLMTPCRVEQQSGLLRLENRARVAFDPSLAVTVEEIKIDDARLRPVWGERLYRVLLRATNPALQGNWSLKITQS